MLIKTAANYANKNTNLTTRFQKLYLWELPFTAKTVFVSFKTK